MKLSSRSSARPSSGVASPRSMGAFLPLVVALAAAACGSGDPEGVPLPGGTPVAVDLAVAERRSVPQETVAVGTVQPIARVMPGTKILGRVESVDVRAGERVTTGQRLAKLESRDLEAAVEQARAAVEMARASVENAQAQRSRMETLHARGSATEKNLEDARTGHRVAVASLRQAEADVATAEVALEYATISAPRGGVVTETRVEPGDLASPGLPMFVLDDLSTVEIVAEVPESAVVGLERGGPARVEVASAGVVREARVDRVVPSTIGRSRTYRVKMKLSNPDGALRSGMFARVAFPRGERSVVTIPANALIERGQLDGVFVVDEDGRARLRWIRKRDLPDGRVEILSGLEDGERIVLEPPLALADAVPVESR